MFKTEIATINQPNYITIHLKRTKHVLSVCLRIIRSWVSSWMIRAMTHRYTLSTEYEFTFRCRDLYLLWIMSLLLLKLPFKVDRGIFLTYRPFGDKGTPSFSWAECCVSGTLIFTSRQRSCGKVMFSQLFVCPHGGGRVSLLPRPFLVPVPCLLGV